MSSCTKQYNNNTVKNSKFRLVRWFWILNSRLPYVHM